MNTPLEDYALIGDCCGAGMVSKSGSIDWLCTPRFDSPACFAALLGSEEHGHWALRPQGPPVQLSRRYRGHSLVLETKFTTETGVVVTDCMALEPGVQSMQLVRIAECTSGLRVRRADGRYAPGSQRGHRQRRRLVAGDSVARIPGRRLAAAGRRDLGDPADKRAAPERTNARHRDGDRND